MISLLLTILAFIVLSGLMAATDAALLSVTTPEVDELADQNKRGGRSLKSVKQELTRALVVVVVLTNTVNVLGPVIVSQQAVSALGPASLPLITVVLALGTIVFSEIVPKAIGTRYAPTIGRLTAFPIRVLQMILYPIIRLLESVSRLFASGSRRIGTEAQIRSLTKIGHQAGFIEGDENRMIQRAFVLNDRTAADIMTPLDRVVSVQASMNMDEAVAVARHTRFSRFPAFGTSPNDVRGVVMVRDAMGAVVDGRGSDPIESIVRPVLNVEPNTRSDFLLLLFRRHHMHLAVVHDGAKTLGVVTLENVLEELVGEIEDERDVEAGSLESK